MARHTSLLNGLSPRGRGTQVCPAAAALRTGSIPAWAGNPAVTAGPVAGLPVYPRVGGEPVAKPDIVAPRPGLSPRGRGTHWLLTSSTSGRRSIPAWAGNPFLSPCGWGCGRVYPRVGGEPLGSPDDINGRYMVYPRVGGEPQEGMRYVMSQVGLSPRGRGTPGEAHAAADNRRSIPAWAGNPLRMGSVMTRPQVYPRVGGEPLTCTSIGWTFRGLSPRGRGTQGEANGNFSARGSIPAWAGNPPPSPRAASQPRVYPRVGGEPKRVPP